jgi:hypothetical protein
MKAENKKCNKAKRLSHQPASVMPLAFVKIMKSTLCTYWYKSEIGKYFFIAKDISGECDIINDGWEVVKIDLDGTWRRTGFTIAKDDCKVILKSV